MNGGCGLSEPVNRRTSGTLSALLTCIIFFGIGLGGQGDVLGAENESPLVLILSTGLEASEELGGSQGAVSKAKEIQKVEAADSSVASSEPIPGISLAKAALPPAAAFAALPVNAVGSDKQPVEKIATVPDIAVIEVVAGRVQLVSGEVQATDKTGRSRTLHIGDVIYEGDTLASTKAASAQIAMEDGGSITLRPETRLKVDSFKFNGKEDGTERSFFYLYQGGFRAVTGLIGTTNKQNYRVTTPAATIGVLGTDHEVVYLPEDSSGVAAGAYNKVNAGATVLATDVGSVKVGFNQMGYAGGAYKLPEIQPIILSLFSNNPAPDSDVKLSSAIPPAGVATSPRPPQPSAAVTSTNVIAPIGEAQKNGEVKYSQTEKKAVAAEIGSLRGFKFGLAPIRWGGDLTETLARRSNSSGDSSFQNRQGVGVRAATFIWQPWLAQVRGGIGILRTRDTTNNSTSGTSSSGYTSLVGSGALAVFPYSRFPFDAFFRVDDGRSSYALSNTVNTVNKTLNVRQSYRPLSGTSNSVASYSRAIHNTTYFSSQGGAETVSSIWNLRHDYRPKNSNSRYGIGYDRNVWNTSQGGGNATWGLQGNFSTTFDKQALGVDARRSESFYALNGADLSSNGLVVRHTYRPDALLSVSSSASVDQSTLTSDSSYNARYLQANTFTSWQPDRELPLYVNASARIYDSSYERLGVLFESKNQVVSAGARYAHTRNLSYALDGSVANSKSNGISNRTVTENGSVNYTADIIKFGDASYNRNANASIGFQSNTNSPSNRTITGGVGHGLGVPYLLAGGDMLEFGVNQSLLARNDRINGQNRTLSHTGSTSWRPVPSGTLSGMVNANVSDIRSVGGDEQLHYQAASLGVNALNQASASSTFRASSMVQWTSNGLGQYSNSASAHVEYRHARAFDVKGLRYELGFNMNKFQSRERNSPNGASTVSSSSLDQNLDYQIGRANVRLSLGLARYGNASSKLIMLHLGRSFGNL